MVDIFAAYSAKDRERVRPIISELEAKGYKCWWDQQLVAGQDWSSTISQTVNAARAILIFWSPVSVDSPWVRAEAHVGLERNCLFPVLLHADVRPPIPFDRIQHILAEDPSRTAARLADALARVGVVPAISAPEARQASPSKPAATARNRGYAFLSYCEEDYSHRDTIAGYLQSRGYGYWEYHEGDRNYQKRTYDEIEDRILESQLMLSIITPHWKKSEWAHKEFIFAREAGKPVFLLRFANPGPALVLAGETFIDFEAEPGRGFGRLGRELDRVGL